MGKKLMDVSKVAAETGVPEIDAAIERINARTGRNERRVQLTGFKKLIKKVHGIVDLDGAFQLAIEDGIVVRWVWCGPEFTEKVVRAFLKGCDASVVAEAVQMKELRLVNTLVGKPLIEELARTLPGVNITIFSEADEIENWRVSQAHYCGENPSEWDANAPDRLKRIRQDEF